MEHSVFNSASFNFLTMKQVKEGIVLTGETKEGIDIGDIIGNPADARNKLEVSKILERRDSVDFPEGNNYFYRVLCIAQ